jgi:hypothetical protein
MMQDSKNGVMPRQRGFYFVLNLAVRRLIYCDFGRAVSLSMSGSTGRIISNPARRFQRISQGEGHAFVEADAGDRLRRTDASSMSFPCHSSLGFGSCKGRLKLGGIKFVLDGSPQARTAFWSRARKGREFDGGAGGIALAQLAGC